MKTWLAVAVLGLAGTSWASPGPDTQNCVKCHAGPVSNTPAPKYDSYKPIQQPCNTLACHQPPKPDPSSFSIPCNTNCHKANSESKSLFGPFHKNGISDDDRAAILAYLQGLDPKTPPATDGPQPNKDAATPPPPKKEAPKKHGAAPKKKAATPPPPAPTDGAETASTPTAGVHDTKTPAKVQAEQATTADPTQVFDGKGETPAGSGPAVAAGGDGSAKKSAAGDAYPKPSQPSTTINDVPSPKVAKRDEKAGAPPAPQEEKKGFKGDTDGATTWGILGAGAGAAAGWALAIGLGLTGGMGLLAIGGGIALGAAVGALLGFLF